MSTQHFSASEADWETGLPGEEGNLFAPVLRGIFAAIDQCLIESGCPLTGDQLTVLRAALAENRVPS